MPVIFFVLLRGVCRIIAIEIAESLYSIFFRPGFSHCGYSDCVVRIMNSSNDGLVCLVHVGLRAYIFARAFLHELLLLKVEINLLLFLESVVQFQMKFSFFQ